VETDGKPPPRRAAVAPAVVACEGSLKKTRILNEKFEPRSTRSVGRREQRAKSQNEKFEPRFAKDVGRREQKTEILNERFGPRFENKVGGDGFGRRRREDDEDDED